VGGFGSSRWGGHARRRCIGEKTLELSAAFIGQSATLPSGSAFGFQWKGGEDGAILRGVVRDCELPRYPDGIADQDQEWERVLELSQLDDRGAGTVPLVGVTAPLGGVRWWLACPECGQRRRALYSIHTVFSAAWGEAGGQRVFRWSCRKCAGLAYHSQRLAPSDRLEHRSRKLAMRIAPGEWYADNAESPPKPKGQHWSTWQRLNRELDTVEERRDAVWIHAVSGFLARGEKRFGRHK
jgi:hypothetical protein